MIDLLVAITFWLAVAFLAAAAVRPLAPVIDRVLAGDEAETSMRLYPTEARSVRQLPAKELRHGRNRPEHDPRSKP